ncbi:glycosyl hydrolase, BNR repeat protein [Anaeromyxobacter dehalogenans 2CP-1]|uniref:Glycosyl hydrolase, BNR repeat protein n=1 Tax=Anaeromyxobacter dehalogenans (strain ATCC BAA-258 / DSM 21875 / 2CP-1) TaxID=455488 RepID=B8J5W9_ANAD2|nr:sialidase family protein [Anaeromyxobacter dehalogenans]ACL65066.1 glycosyl hydrolase, BNR repeat protein [Anaeromyxobacter dehalogenans 2CP-1]
MGTSDRLSVATRKGLFLLERGARGWEIERCAFLGDPVSLVLDDPRDGTLYAALALGHFGVKLHRSDDRGRTWTELPAPAFPPEPGGASDAPSVQQIWALEPAGPDRPGALWAGTIPAALFRSGDRGASWTLVRGLSDRPERKDWGGGGYDQPGLHSIAVDPRDPRRLLCAISTGGVWGTADDGETWALRATGMYAEYMPPERREDPNAQDVHRLVQAPTAPERLYAQHHNGVFRSADGGERWTEITAIRPSKFGFALAVHPRDPRTAWFVPAVKDERRVPVDGKLVVARTRDGGDTFEVLRDGLPQDHAYDLVYRHGLAVDAGGDRLAMGSTTGGLWISEDGGDRWVQHPARLPPIYQVAFGQVALG